MPRIRGESLANAYEQIRSLKNELAELQRGPHHLVAQLAAEQAHRESLDLKLAACERELSAFRLLMEGAMKLYLASGKVTP